MSEPTIVLEHSIKLFYYPLSGHCHRVRLFLAILGLPHELILVDLLKGEHKTQEFLALNPFGQVPLIEENGIRIADSNAILVYLASRYDNRNNWMPREPVSVANTQRWLSIAAGPLVNGLVAARGSVVFGKPVNFDNALATAVALLKNMEAELETNSYLTGDAPTIADVAMYTYTAHAPEGNVDLEPYPNIRSWLERMESIPGFVPMDRSPVGLWK